MENPNAFPACNEANVNDTMGMSLRDWFAGQALAGMCANQAMLNATNRALKPGESVQQWTASGAYAFADAMLAERKKGGAK